MGALRRGLYAAAAVGGVVFGVAACEPGDGLSSIAVAITTDQTGTKELQRQGVDMQWLSCTANVGEKPGGGASPVSDTGGTRDVATVECQGKTKDDRDISIKGKVTEERQGRCVRGDLTAKVGGRVVFEASVLGNCARPSDPGSTPPITHEPTPSEPTSSEPTSSEPTPSEPDDPDPTPTGDPPGPTVTVTVTRDPEPTPTCHCTPGK